MAFKTMTTETSDPLKTPAAANGNGDGFQQERELLHRQMLSAVSHDLKTPLASVIGSLEIYERMGKQLPDDKKEMLIQTALTEAYRLDNFLTNILDMAKLEGNLVPLRIEPTEIHGLLESVVSNLSMRLNGAKVALKGDEKVTATLDPALLSRVITLLLDNASKHAGIGPQIEIRYGKEGSKLTIDVADNGVGIPAGKEEEIFSKYTRLSRGDHQNAGTGLGLAIARLIAKKLNGTIYAENQASGGAVFRLECDV